MDIRTTTEDGFLGEAAQFSALRPDVVLGWMRPALAIIGIIFQNQDSTN